jgi:hypothetical protein
MLFKGGKEMKKPLPIGIEDFEEMINWGYYYIDKTGFIKELIDFRAKVNLFTRPRRFGKTLNMSMLKYFFEKSETDYTALFEGFEIMTAGQDYRSEMSKYPVISMTLKGVDGNTFSSAMYHFIRILNREFERHRDILKSDKLNEDQKDRYKKLLKEDLDYELYNDSLRFLSECLELFYDEKVLVLIDEYDVPLENAYFNGYYQEMVSFIRLLFGNVLKTNHSLAFAVMTGCLRVSKESIFTGLNNLDVNSIISEKYGEYFGFTQEEIDAALSYYQLEEIKDEMKSWYNGYYFGRANVYNPWSSIKYLNDKRANRDRFPDPHWSNTSSNSIIRELIELADEETKDEIEDLIRGGTIERPVYEDIVYSEIKSDMNNLWNFLFFTGYLKKTEERFEERQRYLTLKIPNEEVIYIFERKIREWFNEKIKLKDAKILYHAILDKDTETITDELNKCLMDMISFHDSAENFYHGFLTGILGNLYGFKVKSNREAGIGRSDIYIKSTGIQKKAAIFECKVLRDNEDAIEKCNAALKQIEEKRYDSGLVADGYKDVLKYAVVFKGKECLVAAN